MFDLPDGVGVFAGLGGADVHRAGVVLHQVVDGHVAVVEPDRHKVRVVAVDVDGHHPAFCGVDVLGERRVLESVEQQHSSRLLHKLVYNVPIAVLPATSSTSH